MTGLIDVTLRVMAYVQPNLHTIQYIEYFKEKSCDKILKLCNKNKFYTNVAMFVHIIANDNLFILI